ncbi:MAG: aldehyde dehydrogenase family protein [Bacillota bacterium]
MEYPARLYIAGKWREGSDGTRVPVIDPATEEPFAEVSWGSSDDASAAVEAARRALPGEWAQWSPVRRGRLLGQVAASVREHVEPLARLLTREIGKPLNQARSEVEAAARYLEYYAGLADKLTGMTVDLGPGQLDYVRREPLGVTVHIVPWNYPLDVFCRSVAPSLAAGNTCVVKPAEETSLVSLALARLFEEQGLPPGVLNVVPGAGPTVGRALVDDPRVAGIVFTGSVETGREILAAATRHITPVISMELGGKAPVLVFVKDEAALEGPIRTAVGALTWNAGQSCGQRSRWYVQRQLYDAFIERLVERVRAIKVGPGTWAGVDLGPVASKKQYNKVMRYIQLGREEGARLVTGGGRPEGVGERGFFVAPTVFADCHNGMRIVREEIFGPVISVIPVDSVQEAVSLANDSPYGLSAEVWTDELSTAHAVAAALDVGHVTINGSAAFGFEVPFGGTKWSGFGREGGPEAILAYTRLKNVWVKVAG